MDETMENDFICVGESFRSAYGEKAPTADPLETEWKKGEKQNVLENDITDVNLSEGENQNVGDEQNEDRNQTVSEGLNAGGNQSEIENLIEDELLVMYKECFLQEPTYIVDLDKTEKDCPTKACINTQCDAKADFVVPPRIARSYYCAPEGRNLSICKDCLKIVVGFYEECLDKLRNGEAVSDIKFPTGTEVIIVDDDDEDMLQQELNKERQITGFKEIKEIKEELRTALATICDRFDIKGQMNSNYERLQSDINNLTDKYKQMENDITVTYEGLFQSMRHLYETFAPERKELEEVEVPFEEDPSGRSQLRSDENDLIITGYHPESGPPNLPPFGTVERPQVKAGDKVYVMKVSAFSEWVPAMVEEVISPPADNPKLAEYYKVMINAGKPSAYKKDVNLQLIACYNAPTVRLPVGSRVISRYINRVKNSVKFFSGMIAEMPSHINNFRYLIFFDDGQAQYISHDSIRLVCDSKTNIWEHFNPKVQQFIKRYLLTFPERAMLKVKNLDCIKTEYKGMWVNARVVEIDCSLVHLIFLHDKHPEWLYRGSTRLYPMYIGVHRKGSRNRGGHFVRRNGPYVQYDVVVSDDEQKDENARPVRAVARKSSTRLPDSYEMEQRRLYDRRAAARFPPQQDDGVIEQKIPPKLIKPRPFRPHKCDTSCSDWLTTKEEDTKLLNPLIVPVLYAFSRETEIQTNSISYIAPCGRRLRNIVEVLNYLTETKLKLSLDLFDFDPWVNIFNEYVVSPEMIVMEDLSYGQETIPIPCINTINRSIPTYMDYMTKRRGSEGVYLNLEPEFLVSCDCTDNCQDKSKCACWQLTIAEGQNFPAGVKNLEQDSIGYQYKRLPNLINTAIYECNSGCKCCVKTCLNRVVQHPLKLKLQLFMTKSKGWGTRCLNDIPAGTFVCVYVGNIYTEAVANEDGKMYGDEYFAELDYIEVVEQSKEGYEDYIDPDDYLNNDKGAEKRNNINNNSEDEFEPHVWVSPAELKKGPGMKLRKRSTKSAHSDFSNSEDEDDFGLDESDDSDDQQGPVNVDVSDNDSDSLLMKQSVRNFYGKDESVYIMDAKAAGNIGRYLNHSCDPNIFVQNVFVDTHDLRFPWVAFFALKYIRAGTELTWDYRYEVGSVPGKKMKCYCGTEHCRGRLL